MKVVINRCYGGFCLSDKAFERLIELGMKLTIFDENGEAKNKQADIVNKKHSIGRGMSKYCFVKNDEEVRTDPRIIQVVEELKEEACTFVSELKVVEIPDNIEWEIQEYDGNERIAEKHRTWS